MPCQGPSVEEQQAANNQGKLYRMMLDAHEMGERHGRQLLDTAVLAECLSLWEYSRGSSNTQYDFDRFTARMCKIVGQFTEAEQDFYLYNGRESASRRLGEWWGEHQEVDRQRKERERVQNAKVEARKAGDEIYKKTLAQLLAATND